jgi:hypothetical protein
MSIDMSTFLSTLFGTASDWFNSLIPVFAVVIGITLGIGLLYLVYRLLRNVLPGV